MRAVASIATLHVFAIPELDPANLAVPGGITGAIVVIVVTLIKTRTSDRQNLSEDTQIYIDKITKERDVVAARETKVQQDLDAERALRRAAEDQADRSRRQMDSLASANVDLLGQIESLRTALGDYNRTDSRPRPRPVAGPGDDHVEAR